MLALNVSKDVLDSFVLVSESLGKTVKNYETKNQKVYDEFEKQYMLIMNTSINEYMFTDAAKKNSDDLAAWVVNAYSTGWEYKDNYFGNINDNSIFTDKR